MRPNTVAALLVLVASVALVPAGRAGEQGLGGVAAKIAKTLSKTHAKSVVVFDLFDAGANAKELSRVLADRLSSLLAGEQGAFQTISRDELKQLLATRSWTPAANADIPMMRAAAKELGADAFVFGKLKITGGPDGLSLDVICDPVDLDKKLGEFKAKPSPLEVAPNFPQCDYCPSPRYSDEALQRGVEGVVLLRATITADGNATDIRIVKGIGFGLDEKAIEAVSKWKFKPGKGRDGKPTAISTLVEVSFHVLKRN